MALFGRAFGKHSSSIYFLVAPHGGIRLAERRRSRLALTLAEREVISRGVMTHRSIRSIAKLLGRSPSTVSREMNRNGGNDRYRATLADENAWAQSRRPKCCKLAANPRLRQAVAGKLRLDWSPEQIAGWLKRTHPEDECNQVSHETIYRSLFVQTRGVLKKELLSHLRSKRSMRRSRPIDPNGDRRGHMKDIVSIRQRPAHTRRRRGCSRSCAFLHRYAGVREITRRAQEGRDALRALKDPPSIRAHAPEGALRCARRISPRSHCAEPEDAGKAHLAAEASRTNGLSCMRGCCVLPTSTAGRHSQSY